MYSFSYGKGDGDIISLEKFVPHDYNQFDEEFKQQITPEVYAQYVNLYNAIKDVEFFKIFYMSDGFKVAGILAKPKKIDKKCSVLIYNRGGYKESGKLEVVYIYNELYYLANSGYVVLASQYRGVDGGEGIEECGGIEINDVLNLIKTADTLDYIDTRNIFMIGFSRGGMMTYLALKHKAPINAAVVIAGISDLTMFARMRPDAEKGILEKAIPGVLKNKEKEYKDRSVVCWPDVINKPILLMHNQHDSIISVEQSKALALILEFGKKPYELVIYDDTRHILDKFKEEAHKKIISWLDQYKK